MMIYLLDDQNNVVKEFKNPFKAAQEMNIGKSWFYQKMKENKGEKFVCNGHTFIKKIDYNKPIRIGEGDFKVDAGRYDFYNGEYHWDNKNGHYVISAELADKIFFEYSIHGAGEGVTAAEVRLKNNIDLRTWYSLKNRLQLYKDSDIFSPETRKHYTDEEYQEVAKQKVHELNAYRKKAVVDEYTKYHLKNAKKWRDEANRNMFNHEMVVSELAEWLDKQQDKPHVFSKNLAAKQKPIVVATADWHFGAKVKRKYTNPEYNPEVVGQLVKDLADSINAKMSESVTLILDGDFIETWMGLNHVDSWKSMEAGHFGALVVERVIENMFEPLIKNINNLDLVVGVGGNHDRGTNNNKEDNMAEIASIIFYFLQRFYPKLEFEYDPYSISRDINGIHYIIQHGYHKAPYKGSSIIHDYGSKDLFNLVLTADKHTRGVLIDAWNRRHVKIPPMFTGNFYSTTNGFSSVSGCLFIEEDNGFPLITDKSFYSLFNDSIVKKVTG